MTNELMIPMARVEKELNNILANVDVELFMSKPTVPKMEEVYTLVTNDFYTGLRKLCRVSHLMNKVFEDAIAWCKGKETDSLYCEQQASLSIMESIRVPSIREGIYSNRMQRVLYIGNTELHYINACGVLIGWKQRVTGNPKSGWVFWVGVPKEEFKEKPDDMYFISKLTAAGFVTGH